MRIAMLGVKTLPSASGVEKVVEEVGSRLVARGHQVTVFTRAHLSQGAAADYRGIRVRPTWSIPTKHLDAATHGFAAALSVPPDTDVVHVHTTNFAPAVAICRLRGLSVVVQSHGLDWRRAKWGRVASWYLHLSDSLSRRWCSALVVVSRTLEKAYGSLAGKPPIYAPNGVSRWPDEPIGSLVPLGLAGHRYILFAARLVPEKGCHVLVEAYSRLRAPDAELVIAGDDLYDGSYARHLKTTSVPGVRFVGPVLGGAFRALVQNAQVFVLPSEIEGLSTGLLEAMAAGRAIVATSIPENVEALGDAAVLVPPGDPIALAAVLDRLLRSDEERQRLGEGARRRALALYDWDQTTDVLERTYARVLAARRLSPPPPEAAIP